MARITSRISRAAAAHRRAVALTEAAGAVLQRLVSKPRSLVHERSVRELTEQLRIAAAKVAPGWLGANLDAMAAHAPLGDTPYPQFVRIGTAQPLDDARFPVVLPLGHLAYDADCRDPRVASSLQGVLLRLLAAASAGSVLVRVVGTAGNGAVRRLLAPFAPVHGAGIMPPPVTDRAGLCGVLAEAERWLRAGNVTRTLLLVLAGWPQEAGPDELARLRDVAAAAPGARLHLVIAGWPPPPLDTPGDFPPLPHTTQISVRNPYVRVGDPPGGSFAAVTGPGAPATGLNARVYLDEAPPEELISRVCQAVADRAMARSRVALRDLVPTGPLWAEDAASGLSTVLARPDGGEVSLRLDDRTPHWLIAGRARAGKTSLLLSLLYGLCTRYSPDQLSVYLLDHSGNRSFVDFAPSDEDASRLPHARVVGLASTIDESIAVLQELTGEVAARAEMMRGAQVASVAQLRATGVRLPRLVCVIDEYQPLLAVSKAETLLRTQLAQGGSCGVHTILASRDAPSTQTRYGEPDAIFGRCRLRIALPGGSAVLDAANDAAAGLPLGAAVVNTAGGLGGPRGATRAHEQVVHFPDPYADPVALAGLRHRLWQEAA